MIVVDIDISFCAGAGSVARQRGYRLTRVPGDGGHYCGADMAERFVRGMRSAGCRAPVNTSARRSFAWILTRNAAR